jgi:hypothetical protein
VHRASHGGRRCAVGAIQRLSLARYYIGLYHAQNALKHFTEGEVAPAALVRGAAAPSIPWGLLGDLAAAGTLTSLEFSAPQAALLLEGPPTAAAAAAAAEVVPDVQAMLSQLRSLTVRDYAGIRTAEQLQEVKRLVGACSSLTRLEFNASELTMDAADAPAGPGGAVGWRLPHLEHLVLDEGDPWFVNGCLDSIGGAQLNRLDLLFHAASNVDATRLAACTGLQDLSIYDPDGLLYDQEEVLQRLLEQLQPPQLVYRAMPVPKQSAHEQRLQPFDRVLRSSTVSPPARWWRCPGGRCSIAGAGVAVLLTQRR